MLWNLLCAPATATCTENLTPSLLCCVGEIVPQGICTRYGLAVGYYASWLVRILMVIAWPVAYPLGKILDAVLGHSAPALPRGQLQQFVSLHGEDEGFARYASCDCLIHRIHHVGPVFRPNSTDWTRASSCIVIAILAQNNQQKHMKRGARLCKSAFHAAPNASLGL